MGVRVSGRPGDNVAPSAWQLSPSLVEPGWDWFWHDPILSVPLMWKNLDGIVRPVRRNSVAGTPLWGASNIGTVLEFDGSNDEIVFPGSTPLTPITGDSERTYFFVIRVNSITSETGYVIHKNPFSTSWTGSTVQHNDDDLLWYINGVNTNASGVAVYGFFAAIDTWYNCAVTSRADGTCDIYKDGVLQTPDVGGTFNTPASELSDVGRIGRGQYTSSQWFNGDMAFFHAMRGSPNDQQLRQWGLDPFGPFRKSLRRAYKAPVVVGGFFGRKYYDEFLGAA